jgi:hypothetical protein
LFLLNIKELVEESGKLYKHRFFLLFTISLAPPDSGIGGSTLVMARPVEVT